MEQFGQSILTLMIQHQGDQISAKMLKRVHLSHLIMLVQAFFVLVTDISTCLILNVHAPSHPNVTKCSRQVKMNRSMLFP